MVLGPGDLDEFFGPADGFVLFDPQAQKRRISRDGGSGVKIALVGGPPEGGAQIG